jgi:hypothetical protein
MTGPKRREPNAFYASKYPRYSLPPVKESRVAERPRKRGRIKEVLVHVGLFIAGLVLGTVAGLIVLSLLERWLSNGS